MTPSNRHPQSMSRSTRRAFILQAACGLLAMLLAAPAPALAQDLIHFKVVTTANTTQYEVEDDGANLQPLLIPFTSGQVNLSTARSDYSGGRQYLYTQSQSQGRKKKNTVQYNDIRVWSQGSGQSKDLTNFPAPLSASAYFGRWSNNGQDSFVSFMVYDGTTGVSRIYRALVSADEIASPSFVAISSLSDPRLELVQDVGAGGYIGCWWGHDGSRLYYLDPRNSTWVRAKTVGVGVTFDDDPIVFVAPANLLALRVSPGDSLTPDRYLVAPATGNLGILAMDLTTSTWWWLATADTGYSVIRSPAFSPDGSEVAFGAAVNGRFAVYKVPFFGGPITRVTTEFTNTKKIRVGLLDVYAWNTP